jgi:hypothetical protein
VGKLAFNPFLKTVQAGKVRAFNFSVVAELAVFDSKGSFEVGHVGFLETSTTRRIYFRGELYRLHEFGEDG